MYTIGYSNDKVDKLNWILIQLSKLGILNKTIFFANMEKISVIKRNPSVNLDNIENIENWINDPNTIHIGRKSANLN